MPTLSIPFEWKNAPAGTKQFVLVIEDFDAVEVIGVIQLHWLALIPGDVKALPENASATDSKLIQGENSCWSLIGGSLPKEEVDRYEGPVPPHILIQ